LSICRIDWDAGVAEESLDIIVETRLIAFEILIKRAKYVASEV
jgi:hypothetical protein